MFQNPTRSTVTLAALLVTFAATTPLQAQDKTQQDMTEQLLKCDGISDATQKMACFDAVVQGLKQAPVTPVAEAQPEAPGVPSGTATVSAATAAAAVAVPDAAPPPAAAAPPAPREAQVEEPATVVGAAPPDTSSAAATASLGPSNAEDRFGLEDEIVAQQVTEAKEDVEEIDSIHATIVEVWPTIDDRFEVRLDNGQVWRETELTRRTRKPGVGSEVRITRASLGSFRMKIGNDNRLAAVRRTQ